MEYVCPQVTECHKCGEPLDGGPVCTYLPRLLAFCDDPTIPAVVKYHCGMCCPGHVEPSLASVGDPNDVREGGE